MNETVARGSGWVSRSAGPSPATSAATCDSPAPGRGEAASSSSCRATVLIVEDDRSARTAIARLLTRQGFAVSEAATVAEAIGALPRRPDWVLLDLMLPDGSGVEVLRTVRTDRLPSRVCVVTGSGPELVAEAEEAGADHTFLKPLDIAALMAVLAA